MANPNLRSFRTRSDLIPQSRPLDTRQVQNSAGGFTYEITPLDRIRRFAILGSDGSHYKSGEELTRESAQNIERVIASASPEEQMQIIDTLVDISEQGRAPKQSPALFALALVISQSTDDAVKNYGYSHLSQMCRTASTLFEFVSYLEQFQHFGMGVRKAISRWYSEKLEKEQLGYQMAKYRNRHGFDHSRLLRISKGVRKDSDLLRWAVGKPYELDKLPRIVQGLEYVKREDVNVEQAILSYGLSWEMLPSESLNRPETWRVLIETGNLPLGALLRNLAKMTAVGVFQDRDALAEVLRRLSDPVQIRKARLHPLNILVAMKTYASGHGMRGSLRWVPVSKIVATLDAAFYLAFDNVEPSGKRHLLAVDISGSMDWGSCAGVPISAREAVTALALVIAGTESETEIVAFQDRLVPLDIRGRRLDDAVSVSARMPMGRTDCAQPMLYAKEQGLEVDVFVVMTDNETWAGRVHPQEALRQYREASGIDAKLVVLSTEATRFSIADPADPRTLDIPGFDLSVPQVLTEFARGW